MIEKKDIIIALINYYTGGNKAQFASKLGVTPQTINTWISRNTFDIDKIFANCEGVSAEWLISGQGEMIKTIEKSAIIRKYAEYSDGIPLYNAEASAGFGSFDEMLKDENLMGKYHVPEFKYVDFMMYVKGNSMYPKYNNKDIIACKKITDSHFIQWNKPHVIATVEQGFLVKRLQESERENCILAVSDNATYPPFNIPKDEILGIALVIGVIRME